MKKSFYEPYNIFNMKNSLAIYIPLYNEEEGIANLKLELKKLQFQLAKKCDFEIILVDDGSTDNTLNLLNENFNEQPFKIITHTNNKNLGGFLKTAINDCQKDFIAFLDSDCTYKPRMINDMYELSLKGHEIVNASPYHPEGKVVGVEKTRLFLSKSINLVYRFIIRKNFYTTSSICKIYKTDLVKSVIITRKNFIAISELFTKCILVNDTCIDYPCTLTVRQYGYSKLDIYSNVIDHIKYLFHFLIFKYRK